MSKKNFYRYLEEIQGKENSVVSKIKEIIKFKEKIKDYKIVKENFSFYHYSQEDKYNPTIYTNDENIMGGQYISSLEDLIKEIEEKNLYSENNAINYNIEYLDNDALVSKSFSTEEYSGEREEGKEYEFKEESSSEISKKNKDGEKHEKNINTYSSFELKK